MDASLHGLHSHTPAGCCVPHCRLEIRTLNRFHTNKVLGSLGRDAPFLLDSHPRPYTLIVNLKDGGIFRGFRERPAFSRAQVQPMGKTNTSTRALEFRKLRGRTFPSSPKKNRKARYTILPQIYRDDSAQMIL